MPCAPWANLANCFSVGFQWARDARGPALRPAISRDCSRHLTSKKDHENLDGSFPIGLEMDVSYPNFQVSLTLLSVTQLKFEIKEGPFARIEIVDIQVVPLGNSIFAVSWQEKDGATVTNVQDYDRGLIYSYATLHAFLANCATRIVNEVKGINRVVYDVTSKPPGTIEWE
jgi:hypothetical protein